MPTIKLSKREISILIGLSKKAIRDGLFEDSDDMGNLSLELDDFTDEEVTFDENELLQTLETLEECL